MEYVQMYNCRAVNIVFSKAIKVRMYLMGSNSLLDVKTFIVEFQCWS